MNLAVGAATGGLGDGLPLVSRILLQSGVWGALAGGEAPLRAGEASEVGGPAYGLPEALADVGSGLAAGPIFEGGGALLKGALRPIASRLFGAAEPGLTPAAEDALGEAFAADPVARGALMATDQGLRDAAAVGPFRNGEDFDAGVYALQTGAPPPAIEPNADVGDLFAAPRQPSPEIGAADTTTAPGATLYDATAYRGRPVYAASFDPAAVDTAADLFQYKSNGDAAGVTDRLRGVATWDPTSSGKVLVYQPEDGGLLIADGHQRLGLAKRLDAQGFTPQLDGMLFRQADGWSPLEVRTIAALKNLREGQGTPLDAAKVFRDSPVSLNDDSLPVSGDFIRQAKGLARLSPEAFGAAINGVVPSNYAALIGDMAAARPDLHEGLVRLLHAGEPASLDEAGALIHEALQDDWVRQQGAQSDLFGESPAQSLAIARAKVMATIMRSLKSETRLYGNLVRHADAIEAGGNTLARDANEAALATDQAAMAVISKLGLRVGDIGDATREAAMRVLNGERPADAARGVLARLRRALADGERLDQARATDIDPAPPSAGAEAHAAAFAEPGGKGQLAQIAPKPEEAHLEAPTAEPPEEAGHEAIFEDIAGAEAEASALAELKACAPV
jgi:hypothetical protein